MQAKHFFGKLLSRYLWFNLAAMVAVVVALCLGVKFGLDLYTHHGEGIPVPKIEGMDFDKAESLLDLKGLKIVVTDSGYNKRLPANCILAQNPGYGTEVKSGHTIYVTVNSPSSPSFPLPDIVDNSSSRAAEAKLRALGYKLLPSEYINGEKDWVYGVKLKGRNLSAGDLVPVDAALTLVVGNGQYEAEDVDIDYSLPEEEQTEEVGGEEDPFVEVKEPPVSTDHTTTEGTTTQTNKK